MQKNKHPMLPLLAFLTLMLVAGGALLASKHFAAHAAFTAGTVNVLNSVDSPIQSIKYQYPSNNIAQRGCQPVPPTGASVSYQVDVNMTIEIVQYTSTDCSGNVYTAGHQSVPDDLTYSVTLPMAGTPGTGIVLVDNAVGSPVQSVWYQYQSNGQTLKNCSPFPPGTPGLSNSVTYYIDITTTIEIVQYTTTDCSGNYYAIAHQAAPYQLLYYLVSLPLNS
jgi:hypothetical protein